MGANVVSPVTGRAGIVVGRTPLGDVIQDLQEYLGHVTVTMQQVTLTAAFTRCDGRGSPINAMDGAVSLPQTIAQALILLGAAASVE